MIFVTSRSWSAAMICTMIFVTPSASATHEQTHDSTRPSQVSRHLGFGASELEPYIVGLGASHGIVGGGGGHLTPWVVPSHGSWPIQAGGMAQKAGATEGTGVVTGRVSFMSAWAFCRALFMSLFGSSTGSVGIPVLSDPTPKKTLDGLLLDVIVSNPPQPDIPKRSEPIPLPVRPGDDDPTGPVVVSVPGPVIGAGLPALVLVAGGAWLRRQRLARQRA